MKKKTAPKATPKAKYRRWGPRERVAAARKAVRAYSAVKRVQGVEESFRDLLVDMMHLGQTIGLDFEHEVNEAAFHYDEERTS